MSICIITENLAVFCTKAQIHQIYPKVRLCGAQIFAETPRAACLTQLVCLVLKFVMLQLEKEWQMDWN